MLTPQMLTPQIVPYEPAAILTGGEHEMDLSLFDVEEEAYEEEVTSCCHCCYLAVASLPHSPATPLPRQPATLAS